MGAFSFWKRSAEQGHTISEFLFACCYRNGGGVEPNLDEARRWYARAAAKGHEPSIDALAHLDRKAKEAESERVAADLLRDA